MRFKATKLLILLPLVLLGACGSNDSTNESVNSNSVEQSIDTGDSSMEESKPKPMYAMDIPMIAHKGYAVSEVENTKGSFIEAGKRNFYGIETDIYLTKDGQWVCHHDQTIPGMSKTIMESTLEEVMAVDISRTPGKVAHVATLIEYLDACKQYQKHPYIEFKMTPSQLNLENLILLLDDYKMINEVTFISFGALVLTNTRKLCKSYGFTPEFEFLTNGGNYQDALDNELNLSCQYQNIDEEMIATFKAKGLTVAAWTVDDPNACYRLIDMGVKSITSDFIECDEKYVPNNLYS